MGRPFVEHCEDDSQGRFVCAGCGSDVASVADLVQGVRRAGGDAQLCYIFRACTANVVLEEEVRADTLFGSSAQVQDAQCRVCDQALGVKCTSISPDQSQGGTSWQGCFVVKQVNIRSQPSRRRLAEARQHIQDMQAQADSATSSHPQGSQSTSQRPPLTASSIATLQAAGRGSSASFQQPEGLSQPMASTAHGTGSSRQQQGQGHSTRSPPSASSVLGQEPQQQQPRMESLHAQGGGGLTLSDMGDMGSLCLGPASRGLLPGPVSGRLAFPAITDHPAAGAQELPFGAASVVIGRRVGWREVSDALEHARWGTWDAVEVEGGGEEDVWPAQGAPHSNGDGHSGAGVTGVYVELQCQRRQLASIRWRKKKHAGEAGWEAAGRGGAGMARADAAGRRTACVEQSLDVPGRTVHGQQLCCGGTAASDEGLLAAQHPVLQPGCLVSQPPCLASQPPSKTHVCQGIRCLKNERALGAPSSGELDCGCPGCLREGD